ncbi:methyl-accepting chemotaxis protein [Thiomicrospira sp. ALE5]|uniref:methyl-accepting chemotaxis protein n=1 Tax=Thiomicrospira sp. ALE5 TaxID=748650 RepID=UPI0008E918B1|nr:methyl-accepting chemotaxis protein [Thiomicrospira sp. ALE5]SFR54526.1 methyl-accepting chemotaxis protein [Thiomicrospira sp. ALE5]
MNFKDLTLNTKVSIFATSLGVILALVLSAQMYFINIPQTQSATQENLLVESRIHVEKAIDLKVQSGVLGATAFSMQPNLIDALYMEERENLLDFFAGIRDDFRSKSNFNNIATILFSADGRMLIRSWDLETYGQDATNSPIIQQVMAEQMSTASLAVGARGVGVVAVAPVMDDGEMLGMVSVLQGLASTVSDFNRMDTDWVLLIDQRYIETYFPGFGVVANNKQIGDHHILANNNWFPDDAVAILERHFKPVEGEQEQVFLADGKVIMDLPAFDERGEVMGRHILIRDEDYLLEPIAIATREAWATLTTVLIGLLLLTTILILAVNRMVIKPLQQVQNMLQKVTREGKFSLKADVKSKDEVGKTMASINSLLTNVDHALNESNQVVTAISKGDFTKRIEGDYVGDLDELKQGVNLSVENIVSVMNQIAGAMEALSKGEFDYKFSVTGEGEYARIMEYAQQAMAQTDQLIAEINRAMAAMQAGNYQVHIDVDAFGQLAIMRDRVNDSIATLDKAIKDITRIVVAQSEGDLTQQITHEYQGDLDVLKQAINRSLSQLSAMVDQSIQGASVVRSASDEVAKGAQDLSQRVQEQAAALEQTSATMHEMNEAIQNNTENTETASKSAIDIQQQAEQGQQVMSKTIQAMAEIDAASQQIADIVHLIDSIAFQTNLLALNASVEAARAGEQGRGFAVVAGEVRNLAQKSAESAKNIKVLIDSSVEKVSNGTQLATDLEQRLANMADSINQVSGMIEQIANASSQQAEGIGQVHQAINEIDSVTQQNAALVEETTAAAESMSDQATQMEETMRFFRTANGGGLTHQLGHQPKTPKAIKQAAQTNADTTAPKPVNKAKPSIESKSQSDDDWAEF